MERSQEIREELEDKSDDQLQSLIEELDEKIVDRKPISNTMLDRCRRKAISKSILDERSVLNPDHVEGYPVISRRETIEFMREHDATFQSALAMLDRMYDDLDLDVAYRESEREWL